MHKLSLIIPTYNSELYIANLLNQVKQLNEDYFEVLIINDGSTDATEAICQSYAETNTHIRIKSQPNRGVSSARNKGIEEARGAYIGFLDADDEIDSEALERLYMEVTLQQVDCIVTSVIEKNYKTNSKREVRLQGHGHYLKSEFGATFFNNLKFNLMSYPVNKIYRRSIIEQHGLKFDRNFSYAEDLHFNLDYFTYAQSIWLSDITYYQYNKHLNEQSLSSGFSLEFWKSRKIVYEKLMKLLSCFHDASELEIEVNSYAVNSVIFTTHQIVEQKVPLLKKIKQLKIIANDPYLKNLKMKAVNISMSHKLLWSLLCHKQTLIVLVFWHVYYLKLKYKK